MAKEIQLSQGKVALVDDDDFEWLDQWKWHAHKDKLGKWYARRVEGAHPFEKTVYMHRQIMNTPRGLQVDHRNGDGLHNQRENMRNCTVSQNACNRESHRKNKTGFKGVCWNPSTKTYRVRLKVNKKYIHIGYFSNTDDAAHAYDEGAKKYYGEFARLNFPE